MELFIIWIGKLLLITLRLLGRNGSAFPGLLVERMYPQLLRQQLDQLERGVIIVTGTNGKTTTTKSLVYLLEQSGLRVFTNPTGSNFTRGVYASLIKYSSLSGGLHYDIAVLELDEAYSRVFAKQYHPRLVLALNVMRDQLDRYGEIDKTAEMIGDTISYATDGAVLNYDDKRVKELASRTQQEVTYFAVSSELSSHLPSEDDFHGVSIHLASKHHASHNDRKKTKAAFAIMLEDYRHGSVGFRIGDKIYHSGIGIAGIHNAFNITAALATAMRVVPEMQPQFLIPTIKDIPAAFGRGEVIRVGNQSIVLALVKNPSGFRQSLQSYESQDYSAMAFVINDDFADGRDVSWLWDVDFKEIHSKNTKYTSGTRANDMALRLKYDEIDATVVNQIPRLVDTIIESGSEATLVYCTYTAMLHLRRVIAQRAEVEKIW